MQLTSLEIEAFRERVWEYYRQANRQMPWRQDISPYSVLVSEMMLQQTQVQRVIPKYETFLYTYTNFTELAAAPLSSVLQLWSGLGYNRRAKYLHQAAQSIVHDYKGIMPDTTEDLITLPGIGRNTAGAILAYSYNKPVVFIETNIRTVYFHHFFPDVTNPVRDKELEVLVEKTMDKVNPREWYWALMDYGAYLKKNAGGRLASSRHYVKQAPLAGSIREMRGAIVRALITDSLSETSLRRLAGDDSRFGAALQGLLRDGLIENIDGVFCLTGAKQTS